MKRTKQQDKAWLLETAKAVAVKLKERSMGTSLRVRIPTRVMWMNTDGWKAVIGNLGKNQPRLEVWFDRFSGYPERKLSACLWSEDRKLITNIIKRASKRLWPIRVVSPKDTKDEEFLFLRERLGRSEFNVPVLEKYEAGQTFFGIYDPTRETLEGINLHFCNRAVAFFEDVARTMPSATTADEQREAYPRYENRQQVRSHIQRERSRLLANDRKVKDNYSCQVCGMRFEDVYGKEFGENYAEAHHLIPLSQLKGIVITSIEDLRTVCSNCHRMLHRMDGKRDDIIKLRKIVKRLR